MNHEADRRRGGRSVQGLVAQAMALALACTAPALAAQTVDRDPVQTFYDRESTTNGMVGGRLAVDGDTILYSAHQAGPLSEGFVGFWVRGAHGYEFSQRVWPTGCWTGPHGTIQPGVGLTSCRFGRNFALSGDTAAIVSGGGDLLGGSSVLGLIHILRRDQGHWYLDEIIRAPAEAPGFGYESMALDDGVLALGHPYVQVAGTERRGGVCLFERGPGGRFELAGILVGPPNPPQDPAAWTPGGFSSGLAMDHGVLVVAEWGYSMVHVFERQGQDWVHTDTVRRASVDPLAQFGSSIAVDGRAGVMAASENAGQGRVHVFERDATTRQWSLVTILTPQEGGANGAALFGTYQGSIAIRRGRIAVGARRGRSGGSPTGVAELYRRDVQGWVRERRFGMPLPLPAGGAASSFGSSVALADGRLVVGDVWWAPRHPSLPPDFAPGRFHLFELSEGALACEGAGNDVDLNVLFEDGDRARVHLSAFGLEGSGFGYFVGGTPHGPVALGTGELCVGRAQRLTGPLPFSAGTDRLYASVQHPDPTAPQGTAFQLVYLRQRPTPAQAASVARFVD